MASLLHETIVELIAEHPELLVPALREQLDDLPDVELRFRRGESSTSKVPPLRADLGLELHRSGESEPFAAITVEVQLSKDEDKPFSWLLYHAGQHYRLRVPSYLLVVTNDPEIAAWAAGPFQSGMVTMRPLVIGPSHVPPITDPEEAKRSLERTFLSGLVHASEPVAVDIGIALAAALDASPDDTGLYYWDTLLVALGDALRSTLEMQLENWKPRSEWGKRFLANAEAEMRAGMRAVVEAEVRADAEAELRADVEAELRADVEAEVRADVEAELRADVEAELRAKARAASILDVLDARGLPIEPTVRQRITACTDLDVLAQWLRRAATASSSGEVFGS